MLFIKNFELIILLFLNFINNNIYSKKLLIPTFKNIINSKCFSFSRQSISNSNTDSNNYESARSSLNSSNQEKSPRKPNDENTSIFGTPSTVLNESKNIDKWNGTPAPSSVFMDSKNIDKSSIFGTPTSASTSLFNDTPRSNGTPTSSSSKLNDSTEVKPSGN